MSRPAAILACFAVALALVPGRLQAHSVGATFGNIVVLNGTPSDIVLDEARGRLYLINHKTNRVDVLPVDGNRPIASLSVGLQPLAGAITPDNAYLYVTNYLGSSLSVIDLVQTIPLPTRPQGIEVGGDGSVLVACDGVQSSGVWLNTLLVVDRTQPLSQQVVSVPYPPPPSTPPTIPPANASRPTTTFKSKLVRTPDGIPVPLLDTSGSRISAQLPDNLMPGIYLVQVRSLANGQQSDPVMVTVQRPTPPRAPAPGDSGDPASEEQP